MSTTQTPSKEPQTSSQLHRESPDLYDAKHWEVAYRHFDESAVPQILLFLQDDLARSRRREAAWFSVVLHLLFIILLVYIPKRPVAQLALKDPLKDKELTYLELPPDLQKPQKRPDTNIISDKDRIATSKAPQVDPKELRKIIERGRQGRPGPPVPAEQPSPQAQPQAQPQAPQQAPSPQQQQPAPQAPQPQNNNQVAQLQMPAHPQQQPRQSPPVNFKTGGYVGSQTNQAAQAVASAGGRATYSGQGGDFGANLGRGASAQGGLEVLSDTMGVNFDPYLKRVLQTVDRNWKLIMPESVFPPIRKSGVVAIEFAILKDGSVSGMKLAGSSGDAALERPAWGSITNSNPFPPLPSEFKGQYLYLRFNYCYNDACPRQPQ
jgi:TonB family protein